MTAIPNGKFYIDKLTGSFYLRENNAWVFMGTFEDGLAGVGAPASYSPTIPGLDGADGEDAWPIPGRPGNDGLDGTNGIDGQPGLSIPGLDGADGDDAWPLPGARGLDGETVRGPPGWDGTDGDDAWPIPGKPGTDGSTGAAGVIAGIGMIYSTNTSGDPGSTKFLFDNATFTSATLLNISTTEGSGVNIAALLAAMPVGTVVTITNDPSNTSIFVFKTTGLGQNNTTYYSFPITPILKLRSWVGGDVGRLSIAFPGADAKSIPGRDGNDGDDAWPASPGKDGRPAGTKYRFSSSILTNTDPGDGFFRLSNTPQSGAWTVLAISRKDADGFAGAALFQSVVNTGADAALTFRSADGTKVVQCTVLAGSFVDNTTYYTVTVTPVAFGTLGDGLEMYLDMERFGTEAGYRFTYTSSTVGDPGSGKFLLNNITFGSATTVSISHTDGHGVDVTNALRQFMNTGTSCQLQGFTRDGARQSCFITTGNFVNNGTYDTYSVRGISNTALNNDVLYFTLNRYGDPGPQGASQPMPGRDGEDADPWPMPFVIPNIDALKDVRPLLKAARTYYVRTDGSDSSSGLVDAAGSAFLTVQKAVDTVCSIDMSTFQTTIQIKDGTFNAGVVLKTYVGALPPIIRGNNATPANVVLNNSSGHTIFSDGAPKWRVLDLKLTSSNGDCINVTGGGKVSYGNLDFGAVATGYHLFCEGSGSIKCEGNYTVSGGGAAAHYAAAGGQIITQGITVNIPNNISITNFALANRSGGNLDAYGMTFTGAGVMTGNKYSASINGSIVALSTVFPGTVAGSTATGGVYF